MDAAPRTAAAAAAGPKPAGRARDPALLLSVAVVWVLLAVFILFPLVRVLLLAFEGPAGFSLAPLLDVLSRKSHYAALWNSLLLGALVGLAGTVIGFFFAFTAVRANLSRRWTTLLDLAIILPLISPPFTTAIAMIFSFGPRGLITYDLLGHRALQRLRAAQHPLRRDRDLLPDRLPDPQGHPVRASTRAWRTWPSAWAPAAGGSSARSPCR